MEAYIKQRSSCLLYTSISGRNLGWSRTKKYFKRHHLFSRSTVGSPLSVTDETGAVTVMRIGIIKMYLSAPHTTTVVQKDGKRKRYNVFGVQYYSVLKFLYNKKINCCIIKLSFIT